VMARPDLLPLVALAGAACVGLGLAGLAALWRLGPQELARNNGCRAAAAAGRWAPRGAAD
jgi:hypothetical protein